MATKQYIGARYVPKFYEGTDGTTWEANVYEPLTIVTYLGNSYTSKKAVPNTVGNPAENPEYWAATGTYNAQVEAYREQVVAVNQSVNTIYDNIMFYASEDDLQEAIDNAVENDLRLYVGVANTTATLNIPMSAKITIEHLIYSGSDYAVRITDGLRGEIFINRIEAANGCGVDFAPTTDWSGKATMTFNLISALGTSCRFYNDIAILECWIHGIDWYSRTDVCLDIKPVNKYIGEMHFDVLHYTSLTDYAISISTNDGFLTGVYLGETSVEGSANGVRLNFGATETTTDAERICETLRGTFRVNEVVAAGGIPLKLEGYLSNTRCDITLNFRAIRYDTIDSDGLIVSGYYTAYRPIINIYGVINNRSGIMGNHAYFVGKELAVDYATPGPVSANGDIDYNVTIDNGSTRPFCIINVTGDANITLPASLKCGVPFYLNNSANHTVQIRTSASGNYSTIAGSCILMKSINNSGVTEILKIS